VSPESVSMFGCCWYGKSYSDIFCMIFGYCEINTAISGISAIWIANLSYGTVPYSTVPRTRGTAPVNGHGYMVYGLISVYLRVWYL
jgi:hypothetical protein